MKCRACGFDDIQTVMGKIAPFVAERMLDGQTQALVCECMMCGLLWIDVEPTDEQMEKHYRGYFDEDYIAQREKYEPGFRQKWLSAGNRNEDKYIEQFLTLHTGVPKTILDLGGGRGEETPFRGQSPIDILDVAMTDLLPGCNRVEKIEKKYDLVVLCHILEHVPDPHKLLNDALDSCNDDGFVYIEVPNEAEQYGIYPRLDRVMKERGAWHEHINYFDAISLEALVSGCEARMYDLEIRTWDNGQFIQSIVKKGKAV